MQKIYRSVEIKPFHDILELDDGLIINLEERGLTTHDCEEGKQHSWVILPQKEGQKQYCICHECMTISHL